MSDDTVFQCSNHGIQVARQYLAKILEYDPDEAFRDMITNATGNPVELSISDCDRLLNAVARWEHDQAKEDNS